jgi:hypothetical protein
MSTFQDWECGDGQMRVMDKKTLLIIVFIGVVRHGKTRGINKSSPRSR